MIDIIIVNYNSTDYLLCCLRSVYDFLQELPVRVLIEDNASEDGVDRVKAEFPQVELSKNRHNVGFSKAINNALKRSDSPYIVLLNPDIYVKKGFFESVIQGMEDNPSVGIIGPKILDRDGSIQGSARSFPSALTALFGRTSLLTRLFPNNRFTRLSILTTASDCKTPMEVDWVAGACMVVRRKAVEKVGLMDERFFMYWEDVDWCKRMWQNGWKVIYFPLASVVHFVGISSIKRPFRSIFEFHKSTYRIFVKYVKGPPRALKPIAFLGLALHFCFVFLLQLVRSPFITLNKLSESDQAVVETPRRKL